MKSKITQELITNLPKNEIFVFGSNEGGKHLGGAAKFALDNFGAEINNPFGLQGQSFAIPTLDENLDKLDINKIQDYINNFEIIVKQRTDLHFHITPIGTGIAGFSFQEMAILFAGFQDYANVSLPKQFIDIIGHDVVYGFKAMNTNGEKQYCKNFYYEIGRSYFMENIKICKYGFHFCEKIIDTLNYYSSKEDVSYYKVLGCGQIQKEEDKFCTSVLKVIEKYNHSDKDFNIGNRNSGNMNSGNMNSGNWNSGNRNSGNMNSGDRNSGNRNSGNMNSGNWNSGNRNSGNWNSGNWNSGNWNSGNWNSGNRNSGNWNSGNWNSGFLNSIEQPLFIFNKITDKKRSELYFPNWMNFTLIEWVYSIDMTDQEKEEHKYHEIFGGFLQKYSYKEAAQLSYNKATKEEQRSIEDLPNYDAEILFEIFGIDRRK